VLIAACLSCSDRRPEVDPLSGEVSTDDRTSRLTDADAAALEQAIRCAEVWGAEVVAVTVGPASADLVLREALACGAGRAVRVDAAALRAEDAATALAGVVRGADQVWCGDQGLEAGSGAVPVLVAAMLGAAGVFGLVEVSTAGAGAPGRLLVVRRLDGGRRERLAVAGRAVLSVEGATARLRRAGLPGVLRAERATIDVVRAHASAGTGAVRVGLPAPYRPRPRVVAAPAGDTALDRVRSLTGAGLAAPADAGERRTPVTAAPGEAAELILAALARWGYELPERAEP
jgi:electron transfer flavoprotein beta subunit